LAIKRELKDRVGEGNSLAGLANALIHLSQYEKARDSYAQALAIRIEMKDRQGELKSLHGLGAAYHYLSQFEKARDFFAQALTIARELKDRSAEADALGNLANVDIQLGRYEQARSYLEQTLALKREVKDRWGEGDALMDLGNAYARLSHYEKALDCFGQSLAIKREEKDRKGEAAALGNLGFIYELLSQYEKARDYTEQALAIERGLNDRGDEGALLNNLGRIYSELGDYRKGLDYYRQALEIRDAANDRNGASETINNLALIFYRAARYEEARTQFERALAIKVEVKDRAAEAMILNNLGLVYTALGKYDQARDYDERALAIMREVRDRSGEGRALNTLMGLWRKQEKPRIAIFYGKQAINALQEIRGNIRNLEKESQKSFLAANEGTYRTLADILIETGRLTEAEQVLALLKDEEYSGLLRRGSGPSEEVSYSLAEAETVKIQNQLADISRERSSLLNLSEKQKLDDKGQQRLNLIERELIPKANAEFRVALEAIGKEASNAAAKTAEVKEAQSLMRYLRELGPGTVALYTVISTDKERIDKGWIILVTPDFRKAYSIDVKDLGQTIASFRQALASPNYDPKPMAQKLYRMLFLNPQPKGPTLADDLQVYLRDQKDKTLMWSLDGVLRYVPTAALHDGEKYLVERYRNVVFTTASLAGLTHSVSREWTALGLAVSKSYPGFEALAGARRELAAVVRDPADKSAQGVLPGNVKLDDQFTE
jgi:tetratricopeptide (TPR) repeat protein